MPNKRKAKALTLDDLDGDASRRVSFLRTDARAAVSPAASTMTTLKEVFLSDLEPQWETAKGESAAALLRQLGDVCAAAPADEMGRKTLPGVHLGRASVCRMLRQRALRAVILAREGGPPLLYAHIAVLAQEAGTSVVLLACNSAHLGQPFGLLRASAVGLHVDHFHDSHALVKLVRDAAGARGTVTLPWVSAARSATSTCGGTVCAGTPGPAAVELAPDVGITRRSKRGPKRRSDQRREKLRQRRVAKQRVPGPL